MDLQSIRANVEAIARRAGAAMMVYFDQPHQEVIKQNIFDVVTEGDKASEAVIVPALRAAYPDFAIVSEESGADANVGDAEYVWYIDPLDGTTNFATNFPFFSVSIALADRNRLPLVGVVYNPVYDEMFSAARGFGATLNGKPLHVSTTDDLRRCVLATGFPYLRQTLTDNNVREWNAMLMAARDLRRMGSAALDMCFVAAGRLDGYWEKHINSWDCLAGLLAITEAGGKVSDFDGGTEQLYTGKAIIATNGLIHDAVMQILNGG
jgi:myo-inositol-1(or 4)-monophosphatase